jgi:hypothetical protein
MKFRRFHYKVKPEKELSKYPIMEYKLYQWICEQREKGGCVSGTAIKQKAIELFNVVYENTIERQNEFKASNGWFSNFCKRKLLTIRRITTTGRDFPKDAIKSIKTFFSECQQMVNHNSFNSNQLINMDETSIYLDYPSNYTISVKGAKRVQAVTAGAQRTRLSAAFSATSCGKKLPIINTNRIHHYIQLILHLQT